MTGVVQKLFRTTSAEKQRKTAKTRILLKSAFLGGPAAKARRLKARGL
jgi:hypothetical protein